jgi:hypothetical protein
MLSADHPAVKLIRILARLVPPASWLLTAAFAIAAIAVGLLGAGTFAESGSRLAVAGLLCFFALVSAGIGLSVPAIARRILPPE